MQPIIDEVAEQIAGGDGDVAPLAIQMEESLEVVYETACDVHDDFQKQLNKQAESSCYTTGVVSVRQAYNEGKGVTYGKNMGKRMVDR